MPGILAQPSVAQGIKLGLQKSSGAEFYRCALQINPFDYSKRHNKPSTFGTEDDYNKAIVDACLKAEVDVIGITDHCRASTALELGSVARNAGLHVFLGFEANTSDGVS